MKNILIKLLAVIFASIFLFYLFYSPSLKFDVLENPNKVTKTKEKINEKVNSPANPKLAKGTGTYIGQSIDTWTAKHGYPKRVYPSNFSYDNYVYHDHEQYYIVGVKNKTIVMIYATDKKADIYPFKVGESAGKIFSGRTIDTEPVISTQQGKYQFELSDIDVKTQMLLKYDQVYMQVFVDRLSNKIVAVKYLTGPMLVEMQPYAMSYSGENVEKKKQTNKHTIDEVTRNSNNVLTLFEITNIMREIQGRAPLSTDEVINLTAQRQIMNISSQREPVTSVDNAIEKELDNANVQYTDIYQNLAYNFEDVPSLVNSWMNTDEFREQMMNNHFNKMGGGISNGYTSLILLETKENTQ